MPTVYLELSRDIFLLLEHTHPPARELYDQYSKLDKLLPAFNNVMYSQMAMDEIPSQSIS